jgi:hypothetical protein
MNLTGMGEPEQLAGPCATANWFELQRAQALLGRTFLPDEDQHGRNRVVVLDHGFWLRRFGGDPKVIGRALNLDNQPWLVVGVMPRDFRPMDLPPSPIYTPYVVADNPDGLNVTARLKPGVSLAAAQSELHIVGQQLAREPGVEESQPPRHSRAGAVDRAGPAVAASLARRRFSCPAARVRQRSQPFAGPIVGASP